MTNSLQMVSAATVQVEPQLVEMMVPLYSHGCAKKVHNSLSHLKGIYSVNVDYKQQKVTVWGICNKYQVLTTVRSKRKAARFWNCELSDDASLELNSPLSAASHSSSSSHHLISHSTSTKKSAFTLAKFRSLSLKLACKKLQALTARSYSFGSRPRV